MTYQISLLHADIPEPMQGSMRLGLIHAGTQVAELDYSWNEDQFTATFLGNAPNLPTPAHPVLLLQKPISAIRGMMTPDHQRPTDVFKDHQVEIEVE
ncbi:hypothetical protein [Labrenzia sp. PHM005]|uniref:hypothetical protein n=1 Tax=Stappiaceae TaxID=2821832 RepID=UPI00113FF8BC|nr:hypothetical protein [Labrenzia sp. PHM005]QDG76517.1 hypothetical protein FJ695_11905 [Labrenzia sp. PHM005]